MKDSREALAVATDAVALALQCGATEAEASVTMGSRFSVEARDRTVTKLEQSIGKGLSLRIFVDGRKTTFSTADFDFGAMRPAIERAVAQARHVAADPFAGLPDVARDENIADLRLFDEAIAVRTEASGRDDALAMEREIRASDARVTNSSGSHYSHGTSVTALANSRGFGAAYRSSRASRSASPVAVDGEHKRTAHYGTAARRLADLESTGEVAATAARRTVELFGARKPPTMRVPVILEREVAAALLGDIFAAISAANVAAGNSWLAGRVGDCIGSELVTLVDDGTLPGLLGSAPFDGEGVPTQRTTVFDRGILRSFVYDAYHARKASAQSTGNSSGGGIGPNSFYLEAGAVSLAELIAKTKRGVLVLDTIGFATEHATGSYSRGARGLFVENGEVSYPIDEFTIAAPLPEILARIDGVANDLRFDSSVVSPSFRVSEMTVSGN
jgi:PmbA protein